MGFISEKGSPRRRSRNLGGPDCQCFQGFRVQSMDGDTRPGKIPIYVFIRRWPARTHTIFAKSLVWPM